MITDNGPVFRSNRYLRLLETYGVNAYYSPVDHQQANPVERRVQEFKKIMRALMLNQARQRTWDRGIAQALHIMRSRKNAATGITPSKALLGYELAKPGDWITAAYNRERQIDLANRERRRQEVSNNQAKFNEIHFQYEHIPHRTYGMGDQVMARARQHANREFLPKWTGPHTIEATLSGLVYIIVRGGLEERIHINDLRQAPRGNQIIQDIIETDDEDDPRNDEETSSDEMSSGDERPHPRPVAPQVARASPVRAEGPREVAGHERPAIAIAPPATEIVKSPKQPGTEYVIPSTSGVKRHHRANEKTTSLEQPESRLQLARSDYAETTTSVATSPKPSTTPIPTITLPPCPILPAPVPYLGQFRDDVPRIPAIPTH